MSDQQESRPLTRRERRLLEMAAAGQGDEARSGEAADQGEPGPAAEEVAGATDAPDAQSADHGGAEEASRESPFPEKRSAAPEPRIPEALEAEIEISPVDENGNPRSRREMRRLREEALARLAAETAAAAPPVETEEPPAAEPLAEQPVADASAAEEPADRAPSAETPPAQDPVEQKGPSADAPAEPEAPAPVSAFARPRAESDSPTAPEASTSEAEPAGASQEAAGQPASDAASADEAPGFDAIVAPTEPFSLDELRDAEGTAEEAPTLSDLVDAEASEKFDPATAEEPKPVEAEQEKPKSRLPWRRAKSKAAAAPESEASPQPSAAPDDADAETSDAGSAAASAASVDPEVAEQVHIAESTRADEEAEVLSEIVEEPAAAETDSSEKGEAEAPEPEQETKQGYSFPDIVPPEEWRSVFDDPSTRVVPTAPRADSPGSTGGFDDLISRAVVEEGGTDGSNSAALILPSMPEDGGLSGPIGSTGELFVTGSIDLPKSIGETGGHASLHDSIEMDPVEEPGSPQAPIPSEHDGGPVSARRAVSAVSQTGVPTISEVKKDRSKLPLVLSLTGGTLVLGVGALVVWGAANGFFG